MTEPPAGAVKAVTTTADPARAGGSKIPLLRVWRLGAGEFLTTAVALVATVLAVIGVPLAIPLVLSAVLLAGMVASEALGLVNRPTGAFQTARILLLVAVMTCVDGSSTWAPWLALALLGAVVAVEMIYSRLDGLAVPYAVNLPEIRIRDRRLIPAPWIFYVNCAAIFVVSVLVLWKAPAVVTLFVVLIAVAVSLVGLVDCALRIQSRRRAERRLPQVLARYAPRFAVHWDAAAGTGYQISRWLPYLDRLGARYVVIVRNPKSYPEASVMTDHPVLLRRHATSLDAIMVDSLVTVFYANNALRNVHMVRYPGIRHIQLNHGDSDKAPSYNPVSRMFDKNFVAGQAAIDRFAAHGVPTAPDFFEIVGRPQVEDVRVVPGPIRQAAPRVLYAPTWAGMHTDSAYSSLPIGPLLIRALIARGCLVIYRPHPYANRSAALAAASTEIRSILAADARDHGRAHVWGDQAEKQWSIVDCFNEADALISDVSSVVPDFLYSEKPFAICAMAGTVDEFFAEMPVARAGYVVASDGANIETVLDDLLGADPQLAVRTELKTYYLGDLPADAYAEAFASAARRAIS